MVELIGSEEEKERVEFRDIFTEFFISTCGNLSIVQKKDTPLLPNLHDVIFTHENDNPDRYTKSEYCSTVDYRYVINSSGEITLYLSLSQNDREWEVFHKFPALPDGDTARKLTYNHMKPGNLRISVFSDKGYIYKYSPTDGKWSKSKKRYKDCAWLYAFIPVCISMDGYLIEPTGKSWTEENIVIPKYLLGKET
jgi:hypothetical protein